LGKKLLKRVVIIVSGRRTGRVFDLRNSVSDQNLKSASQKQGVYLKEQMGPIPGTVAKKGRK